MHQFLEWVDYEGGIWEMYMHGWSESQLDECGLTEPQKEKLDKISRLICMADELWQELQTELENQ